MKKTSNTVIGAVVAALLGGSAIVAHAAPNDQQASGRESGHHGLFSKFDTDKDAKITKAEFDAVLAKRFADASGGKSTLSKDQFMAMDRGHGDKANTRAESRFKKMDWNADGQVDRDEFLGAQRVRFNMLDRKGTGEVSCAPREQGQASTATPDAANPQQKGAWRGHHRRHFGKAEFCARYDVNKDGKVTRAEFDSIASAQFQKFAKAGFMTLEGFNQMTAERQRAMQDTRFDRLDTNHDGSLNLQEFSAPQDKMFARLDKANKGYITRDDLKGAHHRFGKSRGDKTNWNKSPDASTPTDGAPN